MKILRKKLKKGDIHIFDFKIYLHTSITNTYKNPVKPWRWIFFQTRFHVNDKKGFLSVAAKEVIHFV